MLTLGGISLTVEDIPGEVYGFVEKNINPYEYLPWLRRAFPGFGYAGLTWPTGYTPERDFRINRFYWPVGACRWAYGHFLASAAQTDQIRNLAFGNNGAGPSVPIPFIMDSPGSLSAERLTAPVYLLPPTPLSAVPTPGDGSVNNLFLLTIVDQRYYWWYVSTPLLQFADTTSWTTAFKSVSTALNITITVDTINSAYLNASPQLNMSYEVIPPWFDALAYNVGHRVVVNYDGTVATQSFATALTSRNNDIQNNPDRFILAGGQRFQDIIF